MVVESVRAAKPLMEVEACMVWKFLMKMCAFMAKDPFVACNLVKPSG